MKDKNLIFKKFSQNYIHNLNSIFTDSIFDQIECLTLDLLEAWRLQRRVFICGNGGSAANAIHIANDFLYGVGSCGAPPHIPGLRVEALTANSGIITCLANDIGYDMIFEHQLNVQAQKNDILIILSGSGNSPNVINALKTAKQLEMKSYAISAFSGGKCKEIADISIHFNINDMQIAEDSQLILGHLCMQWLATKKTELLNSLDNG